MAAAPARPTAEAPFLREVRDGACRWIDAVLGPDCNAAHADHFHFNRGGAHLFWIARQRCARSARSGPKSLVHNAAPDREAARGNDAGRGLQRLAR